MSQNLGTLRYKDTVYFMVYFQEEEVTYQEDNAELFAVRKKEQEDKEWLDRKAKRPFSRTRPHFTLQDHFEHLNVRKKWE